MARRKRNPWTRHAFDASRLGLEASMVIGLRLAKLATGGPAALLEAQRMVVEKSAAALEAQVAFAAALTTGGGDKAHGKALACYARHVRANRKRLSRH
jgi:hypothetical protein